MNRLVLDASVALSWAFEDESSAYGDKVLDAIQRGRAVVPAIWPLEVANGLRMAERRKRLTRADATQFLGLLRALPVEVQAAGTLDDMEAVFSLASETGLSAYDASYLRLAMAAGLPLASLDDALRAACHQVGVRCL